MKKEQVIELGIDEETAKQVMALHGADITKAKAEATGKDETITDLQKQIAERDKDLAKLGKENSDNEELKKQLDDLKQQYKDAEKANAEKLTAIQRDTALSSLLAESKVKNPKAVAALLDDEKIVFKDGELSGAKEQIESLKESDPYLFDLGTKQGSYNPASGKSSATNDDLSVAMKDKDFNMTEYLKNKAEEND